MPAAGVPAAGPHPSQRLHQRCGTHHCAPGPSLRLQESPAGDGRRCLCRKSLGTLASRSLQCNAMLVRPPGSGGPGARASGGSRRGRGLEPASGMWPAPTRSSPTAPHGPRHSGAVPLSLRPLMMRISMALEARPIWVGPQLAAEVSSGGGGGGWLCPTAAFLGGAPEGVASGGRALGRKRGSELLHRGSLCAACMLA